MIRYIIVVCIIIVSINIAIADRNSIPLTASRRKKKTSGASGSRNAPRRSRSGYGSSRAQPWPNGVVYYKIDNSLSAYRNKISAAMKNIESRTCVKFQPRTSQSSYVQLFNGDGCYSSVGKVGGRQYLSLGRGCHDIGSAIHEIGHALGLYHEHMRSDRDNYITISWDNIESGMQEQFAKVPSSVNPLYTKFDFSSIMIYGNKAFSKNGRNTMTPKAKGNKMVESHFKKSLSASDAATIKKIYRCQN